MSRRVVVAGAGISGLTAAFELQRAGADVVVLEGTPRPGGVIGTFEAEGFLFEDGPTAVQGECAAFLELCREVGLAGDVVEADAASRERYLYFHGSLKPLPRTFRSFLRSQLFTPGQKLRVMLEPLIRRGDHGREETVAEFFGRRVGRGVTMTWVDVVVSGVYGGSPNRLGIRSAFPQLARMEDEHGSILRAMRTKEHERRHQDGAMGASGLCSLRGGMHVLTDRLAAELGDRVRYRHRLTGIRRRQEGGLHLDVVDEHGRNAGVEADRVLLAVSASTTGILIGPLAPSAADLLFEVESSPLVVAQAGFDESQLPGLPRGHGYLVPRCMRMRTLGWFFASHLFPGRAPEGKVALEGFVGGILDPHAVDLHEDLLRHLLLGELALALGQRRLPDPEVFRLLRWKDRLPQYNIGHLRRMEAVRLLLGTEVPEAAVAGNWVSGITVEACIARAREAAREVLQAREPRGVES